MSCISLEETYKELDKIKEKYPLMHVYLENKEFYKDNYSTVDEVHNAIIRIGAKKTFMAWQVLYIMNHTPFTIRPLFHEYYTEWLESIHKYAGLDYEPSKVKIFGFTRTEYWQRLDDLNKEMPGFLKWFVRTNYDLILDIEYNDKFLEYHGKIEDLDVIENLKREFMEEGVPKIREGYIMAWIIRQNLSNQIDNENLSNQIDNLSKFEAC